MGIYDRDYYREERPGLTVRGPRSIVVTLILINVVLYLANGLLTPPAAERSARLGRITEFLAASDDTLVSPWLWWQFLTYGFAHDSSPMHILFNMLQLWFLGRVVEQLYGRAEFLRLYLVMIVLGSLVWAIITAFFEPRYVEFGAERIRTVHRLIGASGAVCGVVILFILNFPRQTLILFPIPIPVKAWVIGMILVVANIAGALAQEKAGNTAFGVHLTGIVFAFLYFRNRWNLSRLSQRLFSWSRFKPRPALRIHDPPSENDGLSREVDRILEKIHRQGEHSLTRKERRTLESASREYQKRRQVGDP